MNLGSFYFDVGLPIRLRVQVHPQILSVICIINDLIVNYDWFPRRYEKFNRFIYNQPDAPFVEPVNDRCDYCLHFLLVTELLISPVITQFVLAISQFITVFYFRFNNHLYLGSSDRMSLTSSTQKATKEWKIICPRCRLSSKWNVLVSCDTTSWYSLKKPNHRLAINLND